MFRTCDITGFKVDLQSEKLIRYNAVVSVVSLLLAVTAALLLVFTRYQPVHLLAQHHEHDAVFELFRAANICVVTSLHDGMNLVCKEFVAARDDLQGVLVLSRFAGAARELAEALIVNPYHVEETADALHRAATMPAAEQRERMASLRSTVREFNVFRWAGRMLADAGRWRLRARIEARVRRSGRDCATRGGGVNQDAASFHTRRRGRAGCDTAAAPAARL